MKRLLLLITMLSIFACNTNKNGKLEVIKDVKDSLNTDCYENFFKGTDQGDLNKIEIVLKDGSKHLFSEFAKSNYDSAEFRIAGLKDEDKDGVKELWLRGFTGGAHCCDEWTVFLPTKSGSFEETAKLSSGDICVDKGIFVFDLSQTLGYFKSCYACGFGDDSITGFVQMRQFNLKYNKGRFEIISYTAKDEQQLLKNLEILNKKITDFKPANAEDEELGSLLKEFTMNIAVYYFNHNKDWGLTKLVFDKYYPASISDLKADEIKEILENIKAENSF